MEAMIRKELMHRFEHLLDAVTEEVTEEFIRTAIEDISVFDRKQHDYGPHNIGDFGEGGVLVRVNDKVSRLKRLIPMPCSDPASTRTPRNESIEDSWRDLSVYAIIARLVRAGKWFPGLVRGSG